MGSSLTFQGGLYTGGFNCNELMKCQSRSLVGRGPATATAAPAATENFFARRAPFETLETLSRILEERGIDCYIEERGPPRTTNWTFIWPRAEFSLVKFQHSYIYVRLALYILFQISSLISLAPWPG